MPNNVILSDGHTSIDFTDGVNYFLATDSLSNPLPGTRQASGGNNLFRAGSDLQASQHKNRVINCRITLKGASIDDLAFRISAVESLLERGRNAYLEGNEKLITLSLTLPGSSKSIVWDVLDGDLRLPISLWSARLANNVIKDAQLTVVCKPYGKSQALWMENLGRNTHFTLINPSNNSMVAYNTSNCTLTHDKLSKETLNACCKIKATGGVNTNNHIEQSVAWNSNYHGRTFSIAVRYKFKPLNSTTGFVHLITGAGNLNIPLVGDNTWRWGAGTMTIPDTATSLTVRFVARNADDPSSGADELWIDRWALYERPLAALDTFAGANGEKLETRAAAIASQPWNVDDDGWSIQSNQAVQDGGAGGQTTAWVETNKSDVIVEADVTLSATANKYTQLLLRYKDRENYFRCDVWYAGSGADVVLYRVANNTLTTVTSATVGFAAGSVHNVRIQAQGSTWKVYTDNVLRASGTDSTHITATKHGIAYNGNQSDVKWDNFTVRDFAASDQAAQDIWIDGREIMNRNDQASAPSTDPPRICYVDALVSGDVPTPCKLYFEEQQTPSKLFLFARHGTQRLDTLIKEGESFGSASGNWNANPAAAADANATGGYKLSAQMSVAGQPTAASPAWVEWSMPMPAKGSYRVVARGLFQSSLRVAAGVTYAGLTVAPTSAGDYVTPGNPNAWDLVECGTISVPPTSVPDNETPGVLGVRLNFYEATAPAQQWLYVDYIALMPVDDMLSLTQSANGYRLLVDSDSRQGGVHLMSKATYAHAGTPTNWLGHTFQISPSGTRVYILSASAITDTFLASVKMSPSFLSVR